MDVSSVYFRRLLQSNASQIFSNNAARTAQDGSYALLVGEMQKLARSHEQAYKVADALDTSDGDIFRDFDLSTFMDHFRLDAVAKMTLALACRTVSKQDIRTKGMCCVSCSFVFARQSSLRLLSYFLPHISHFTIRNSQFTFDCRSRRR